MDEHPELQPWHAPEVYWPVAERTVRVVKTVRQQAVKHVRVQRDEQGEKRAAKKNSPRAEHEFLRQQFGARFGPSSVYPSIRPQPLDH